MVMLLITDTRLLPCLAALVHLASATAKSVCSAVTLGSSTSVSGRYSLGSISTNVSQYSAHRLRSLLAAEATDALTLALACSPVSCS